MKVIGITGGVGAGKTSILTYLSEHYNCKIILADKVAHLLQKKGNICYDKLLEFFGTSILDEDQEIDRVRLADLIFKDKEIVAKINHIVHPEVKREILSIIEVERSKRQVDAVFLEAALLIEAGYVEYLDELWYIFSEKEIRKNRIIKERNYSEKKVNEIMDKQLSEEEFKQHCNVCINNSFEPSKTFQSVDKQMSRLNINLKNTLR
ncbi:MAG: dephospho-CoA kinase [Lachnospiraceae bacterium]